MDYQKLLDSLKKPSHPPRTNYPADFLKAAGAAIAKKQLTADLIITEAVPKIPELKGCSKKALRAALYRAARRDPAYQPPSRPQSNFNHA